jgi:hypothetical protein
MYHNSVIEKKVFNLGQVSTETNETIESIETDLLLDQIFLTESTIEEQWVTNLKENWMLN